MSYGTNAKHRTNRHSADEGASLSSVLPHAALGMLLALLCSGLMLLIGAMVCLRSENPTEWILPWGLAALYLPAMLGGIVTVRRYGGAPLLCGALCGLFVLIFFWLVSIFFGKTDRFSLPISFLLRFLIAMFSVFGALLGRKRAGRRLHRKR